jgi:hypothetical protein
MNSRATGRRIHGLGKECGREERIRGYRAVTSPKTSLNRGGYEADTLLLPKKTDSVRRLEVHGGWPAWCVDDGAKTEIVAESFDRSARTVARATRADATTAVMAARGATKRPATDERGQGRDERGGLCACDRRIGRGSNAADDRLRCEKLCFVKQHCNYEPKK